MLRHRIRYDAPTRRESRPTNPKVTENLKFQTRISRIKLKRLACWQFVRSVSHGILTVRTNLYLSNKIGVHPILAHHTDVEIGIYLR